MNLSREAIQSYVFSVVSHAAVSYAHNIFIGEPSSEGIQALKADTQLLTDFIMNEIEHARKEV